MVIKKFLTNERLGKRFINPFHLVNYAIDMAKTKIQRGEDLQTNLATKILEVIADEKDLYERVEEDEEDHI